MPHGGFGFGPFRLDVHAKQLLRDGEAVVMPGRLYAMLVEMVEHAGEVVSKRRLMDVGWPDLAVTENSLVQAIRQLRLLLDAEHPERHIETVARLGYRFVSPLTDTTLLPTEEELDRMMEPHLSFIDGRAALLSLDRDKARRAFDVYSHLLTLFPRSATCHVGLANAALIIHQSTRAEAVCDTTMLDLAEAHAREARRLQPDFGEAWITHGFVLSLLGDVRRAVGAFRKGVELDPLSVRHYVRFAFGTWGEDRILAALEALRLQPRAPQPYALIATVFVARDNLDRAERELDPGLDLMPEPQSPRLDAPAVGLHWMKGLIRHARGQSDDALLAADREIALEDAGHFYSRECAASAWYLKSGVFHERHDEPAAIGAYAETLRRVPNHPMALAATRIIQGLNGLTAEGLLATIDCRQPGAMSVDHALACAVILKHLKRLELGVDLICRALEAAPPGNAGWLLPVDPLLNVQRHKAPWSRALDLIDRRAGNWLA
jgi:DNA-binding winged helix-turn-helix (wHTH) protein